MLARGMTDSGGVASVMLTALSPQVRIFWAALNFWPEFSILRGNYPRMELAESEPRT